MAEQLLDRRTTYGWLSLLAAMAILDVGEVGQAELAARVSFPVAVIDPVRRQALVMSPRLPLLLGLEGGDPGELDLHVLVNDPDRLEALMEILVGGEIDACESRRDLRTPHGETLRADNWVAVISRRDRSRALWVLSPVGDDAGRYLAEPSLAQWPEHVSDLAVGVLDADWRIERVSTGIESLLAQSPADVIGSSFVHLVHDDDVPAFLSAIARSLVDRAGVGAQLRLRHQTEGWLPAQVILTPLAAEPLSFGFALVTTGSHNVGSASRVADLERHLWRIAQEVEASGVAAGFERVPDPESLPGLSELSARQWEVMRRLFRGEHVPTMAEELNVSQSTVRNHLAVIFRKVGVNSQQELLRRLRTTSRRRSRQDDHTQ